MPSILGVVRNGLTTLCDGVKTLYHRRSLAARRRHLRRTDPERFYRTLVLPEPEPEPEPIDYLGIAKQMRKELYEDSDWYNRMSLFMGEDTMEALRYQLNFIDLPHDGELTGLSNAELWQ